MNPLNWKHQPTGIYKCLADNQGREGTAGEACFSAFGVEHEWFFKDHRTDKWVSGSSNDLQTMQDLRYNSTVTKEERLMLKQTIQVWTPSALLKTKKKGAVEIIRRTHLLQLDFDYGDIKDYDLDELMQAAFALPFVCFCSRSCSGTGFYILILIAEPEKLEKYAEHCFRIFEDYGVKPDTSKGRNVTDLRFISYDPNMLIRDNPTPLHIKHFKPFKQPANTSNTNTRFSHFKGSNAIVNKGLEQIRLAPEGNRFPTVQRVAYTFGGLADNTGLLDAIIETIKSSSQFAGVESKYIQCAIDCFRDGSIKPLIKAA